MKQPRNAAAWWSIKNDADDADVTHVYVYDRIGEDFWTDSGVSAKRFVVEFAAIKTARISLHINSPGGSVWDGQAIFTAIANHPSEVTTYIDGLAASIASVIALAGDRVVMASNALFMIHDPAGGVWGSAADMRKMADVLDQIKATIVGTYASATGQEPEALAAAMTEETWYTAAEALEAGFVDEVSDALAAAATFDLSQFGYRHVPQALQEPVPVPDATNDLPAGAAEDEQTGGTPSLDASPLYVPGHGFHTF